MKSLTRPIVFLLLAFACSSGEPETLPIVPFASTLLAPISNNTTIASATLPQLRSMLAANKGTQLEAAKALVKAGDDATIQRLVYALKQGNGLAATILEACPSANVIPYLLEDVAHGSMEPYQSTTFGGSGRVRVTATQIVAAALANTPGLPAETAEWLNDIAFRSGNPLFYVPEKSKVLLDWWANNGAAVLAGRANDASWLPSERTLAPRIFETWNSANQAKPPAQPPAPPSIPRERLSHLPLHIDESFENWAARVGDPKRRDIIWATVDYESGRSVKTDVREVHASSAPDEHPNRGNNQSSSPTQGAPRSNSSTIDDESGLPSSTPWSVVVVLIVAATGLLWLLVKKRK